MGVIHRRQTTDSENAMWRWDNVAVQPYIANNATKQVIIGKDDGANNFEVRYFTIPPHGFSSLDDHQHDHGVVIVQGRARVMLGERFEEVGVGDVIYIPGRERHQFENLTDDLFSFLCIIPPKPPVPDTMTESTSVTAKST